MRDHCFLIINILFFSLAACTTNNHAAHPIEAAALNLQLGLIYLKENNWLAAENRLRLAAQQNPNSVTALNGLAYVFQKTQRHALAYDYYEQAEKLQPNNPEVLNHFGAFLCGQGDYVQGMKRLQKARHDHAFSTNQSIEENLQICASLLQLAKKP